MDKKPLGKSNIYVSELTLGCMSLGTDKKQANEIINKALDMGINHLDTADLYDFGLNETIVGEAIKNKRDQVVLTTKVGNHFNRTRKDWFWDPSKQHIQNGIKESLHRLQTDYIDLYLLHGGTIEDNIDETIEAFEGLKKEGLIRAYGISSIRPNVIKEYVERSNIDAVMLQYNILDRRPEEQLLDLLNKQQISVLARGPLAKGIFSSKDNIHRKGKAASHFNHSQIELEAVFDQLDKIAQQHKISIHGLLFQYVLKPHAVTSAVFGVRSIQQLKANI